MGKPPKNTSRKAQCDWKRLTAPPLRRGKLRCHNSSLPRATRGGGPRSGGRGACSDTADRITRDCCRRFLASCNSPFCIRHGMRKVLYHTLPITAAGDSCTFSGRCASDYGKFVAAKAVLGRRSAAARGTASPKRACFSFIFNERPPCISNSLRKHGDAPIKGASPEFRGCVLRQSDRCRALPWGWDAASRIHRPPARSPYQSAARHPARVRQGCRLPWARRC